MAIQFGLLQECQVSLAVEISIDVILHNKRIKETNHIDI